MSSKPATLLELGTITIRAARLGPPSPLPPLRPLRYIADEIAVDESVPDQARQYLSYGCDAPVLPYDELNNYGRIRQDTGFRVAILENDRLRAIFLLDFGGRLWSLFDKPFDRQLLYTNAVLQPTNQAVRNAWFSGGVEWNVSLRGHCPFTCAPLFAEEHRLADGTPLLRMFEFERVRRVPFAVDCWLPAGSEFLFVKVHLWNPHGETIPMYWWSNIAMPEQEGMRVLVPTDHTFHYGYRGAMRRVTLPTIDSIDSSYPTNLKQAADYFYDIPAGQRPWIAAVDAQGRGLAQVSTLQQRGRKMFVWGMASGGRRWQRFLTEGAGAYFEIQAGLAQTQYECLPMPGGAYWSWVEAYGPIEADADVVHHHNWSLAVEQIGNLLDRMLPTAALEDMSHAPGPAFDAPPRRWLNYGSGWGAVEAQVRRRTDEHSSAITVANAESPGFALFPVDSVGPQQRRWLDLATSGEFPSANATEPPDSWLVGTEWRRRLEAASGKTANAHWLTYWHLGVMAYHDGDKRAAQEAWRKSLQYEPNAWSYRNLAVLATENGEMLQSCEFLLAAYELQPAESIIGIEYAESLKATGRMEDLLEWYKGVDRRIALAPRLLLIRAQAQLATGQLDAVEEFLSSDFELPDLREGDTVLTDLWSELKARRYAQEKAIAVTDVLCKQIEIESPPPPNIDFRMGSLRD